MRYAWKLAPGVERYGQADASRFSRNHTWTVPPYEDEKRTRQGCVYEANISRMACGAARRSSRLSPRLLDHIDSIAPLRMRCRPNIRLTAAWLSVATSCINRAALAVWRVA